MKVIKIFKYGAALILIILLVKLWLIYDEGSQNKKNILSVKIGDKYENVTTIMKSKPISGKLNLKADSDNFALVYGNGLAAADYIIIYFSRKDSTVISLNLGD